MLVKERSAEMAFNKSSAEYKDAFTNMNDSDDGFFKAIIGAVIAAVVLVFICLFVVILRYMYRYKGTYHTNEAKGTEFAETADVALRSDPALQDSMDESKKEYFI
ncbi:glycophorin-C isoform X2 [Colossoma macropomum]|uniref:glycophorin-C isoform X2 n=1 Tax=Colossoma macropomum TaxID=42526 RepID=UPI0018651E8F|nr:glycophorin-C isoform X2 [Colossoma macropomum]